MNHPTDAELLLLAYSEVPEPRNAAIESHVAACHTCRATLAELERGRVALDVALPPRRRSARVWIALAAAAVLAGLVMARPGPARDSTARWTPTATWSATAGYVTDRAMLDIDAQLTRLERERYYGLPN